MRMIEVGFLFTVGMCAGYATVALTLFVVGFVVALCV